MVKSDEGERPDWRDERMGTKVRVALWLLAEVGEGCVFTRDQLRAAFPNAAQVDRRMRDLRDDGWVIETQLTQVSLKAHEMLFVRAGAAVWDPSIRAARQRRSRSARLEALARDGYSCVRCGQAPGERFLDVAYTVPLSEGGQADLGNLITLCANCNALATRGLDETPGGDDVWMQLERLSLREQSRLLAWMAMGRRPLSPAERAWQAYRRLPADRAQSLRERLGEVVNGQLGDDEAAQSPKAGESAL
ncbi:hypothetical protein P3T35_000222 [Kitasatospora sp. GP30]|nr:hypothetical protein [Kitasatospora sp. GP30]